MTQSQKTMAFVGVAVLAVVLAAEPWRSAAKSGVENLQVVQLFPSFTDPAAAQSLEIMKYDEATAALHPFSIKKVDGQWVIPSHSNYPADAKEHLAAAATTIMGLESLSMPSSSPGEFETFGVVDPDIKSLKPGMVGVGMRVTMRDASDKVLADLIIGKEPKDQPELRYVRRAGYDQVYIVKLKTDKLSTKFEDWIEKDLLKLNAFDIRQLQLNDYSIQESLEQDGLSLSQLLRSKMKLAYDDEKAQWNLAEFVEFKKGSPVVAKLKDDEELNTEKLNGLKSALDDLQIVDVERKPKGLSRDLRASEAFVKDREAVASLARRGFFPVPTDNGYEVLSSEGEVLCLMKDGVEYTLRFGNIAAGTGQAGDDDGKKDEGKNTRRNRYLFVNCTLHEDMIPQPKLEEVPELPADAAEEKADDKKPADGAPPAKDEAKPAAPTDGKQSAVGGRALIRLTAAEEKATKDPAGADAKPAADQPAGEAKPAEVTVEEPAGGKIRAKAREAKAIAEKREAIEKENNRKTDEYNEKLKKSQDRVAELNGRFADWYYVISDDVYHKIHLSRADVVKTKEKPAGKGDGLGDFKALQGQGLPPHDHDHDHDHDAKPAAAPAAKPAAPSAKSAPPAAQPAAPPAAKPATPPAKPATKPVGK